VSVAVVDAARLRRVFGVFPTGVAALAALVDGVPVGMAASSFTSVSLDPPLVSVCIAQTSTTWPVLSRAPRVGVSILSWTQVRHGRQLAAKHADRFAELEWRGTADGAVVLQGSAGWLDTSVEQQVRAGDHDIVVLRVHDLDAIGTEPLVFHASRFRTLKAR
jgi:flavin reductase (DIM6/NTAB) family NADH-FMN oxidoreductase RutF